MKFELRGPACCGRVVIRDFVNSQVRRSEPEWPMRSQALALSAILILTSLRSPAQSLEEKFHPLPAPKPAKLLLKTGDRLAVCGDSITEQRMYSRMMEDYLTVCVPELQVTVRQYGWSGEKAPGFLARMTNDCLRFKPTIATTCYGMNDHEYRTYEDRIGKTYEENSRAIVEAFKAHGARVIQGSPGCIGKVPFWTKTTNATVDDLNVNLCNLRNIGIGIAETEKVGFADVFWPMLTAGKAARERYSTNYMIAGRDGVHPGWAGHAVMAYAFLKAFGISGEIGTYTLKLNSGKLTVSKGHKVVSSKAGRFEIESSRYPFCICEPAGSVAGDYPECGKDDPSEDKNIRSATTLIPFNEELNRLVLIVSDATKPSYKVTWGTDSKPFTGDQLKKGVNLAAEFPLNPFSGQFAKVDAAVAAKQAFETKQIKTMFHGREAKTNMVAIVESSEKERAPLAQAIKQAFVPVKHTLSVLAE